MRPASSPALRADAPTCASLGSRQRRREGGRPLEGCLLLLGGALAALAEATLGSGDRRASARGAQRQDALQRLDARLLHRAEVRELVAVAGRHGAREEDPDGDAVVGGPRSRDLRDGGVLAGEVGRVEADVLDPGVDAVPVGEDPQLQRGAEVVVHPLPLGFGVVVAAGHEVVLQSPFAGELGQPTLGGVAERLELEQPVLGDRVAGSEPRVGLGLAANGRNAGSVAGDRHARPRDLGTADGPVELERQRLALEVDEQLVLVVEVRGPRAVGDPGQRHESALPRRQDAFGTEDRSVGRSGRRKDRQRRGGAQQGSAPHERKRTVEGGDVTHTRQPVRADDP